VHNSRNISNDEYAVVRVKNMNLKDAINKRKSIRSFENKSVPKLILKELIVEASKAPSAGNHQPWIFYVITSKAYRDKISKLMSKGLQSYKKDFNKLANPLKKVAFNFYSDMGGCQNIIFIYSKKNERWRDNNIKSISTAVENLVLSAVDKGLGTCWIGSFNDMEKDLNKILKIPKDEELVASVLIGYPKKGYIPLQREKKSVDEITKFI
jgi:nitroreductase